MFEESERKSFAQRENAILELWQKERLFEQSVEQRKGAPLYTFYDGPPFATGLPHYGHLLAGSIKDVVCRAMTMKGYLVPRRFGWDCHGLPVESLVEKKEGLSGAASIREYGIARFNETCRANVLTYTEQWRQIVERMGRWIDMERAYKTMDLPYMESVWWVFKQLFDKGLVYKGYKVMPFSWKLGTPLSNFEAGENYQSVDDPSLVIAFRDALEPDLYYLAWTTTPWTLLSNMALIIGSSIEYLQVRYDNRSWIVAKNRVEEIFKNKSYQVEREWLASDLMGRKYFPLFEDFAGLEGAFSILADPFVLANEGTGIVHAAPAFGESDFEICRKHGVPLVCPINENGLFTEAVARYSGRLWKDCQKEIIREIKQKGQLFDQGTINHRYPFCYRTDTPLIYRVTDTWFIAVEKLRDKLVAHNRSIHWVPEHIREGRFGKWLEGAKDWAVSRNRFWGTPIPLWQAETGELLVVGSKEELERLTGHKVEDLHRHLIDSLVIEKEGKLYRRIDGVFDCWFESGCMPYGQNHYPFENRELVEKGLPADFIAEGLDQTRGWFYTLHVLSCALFDKPAFKNVIVNGIVLAEDGAKMSKRLSNYPDPLLVLERYGADALRLYLLKSPVVRGEDLAFNEQGVDAIVKQVLLPWWNVYQFLSTYARLYRWRPSSTTALKDEKLNELDRWALSRLQTLIETIDAAFKKYHLWEAIEAATLFIDQLTNWYIRRSRRRFWSEEQLEDRQAAMHTLHHLLITLCRLMAPFAPFLSEGIYQLLRDKSEPSSVHLCDWPVVEAEWIDRDLEQVMDAIQRLASMGHGLRKEHKLRVRQPLAKAWIADASGTLHQSLIAHASLLADELNVKAIELKSQTSDLLRLSYKPNFKSLGKRAGKKMRELQRLILAFESSTYSELQREGHLALSIDGETFDLLLEDVEEEHSLIAGTVADYSNGLAIALETQLDEALLLEGMARELVNKINSLRKEKELDISDRIELQLSLQRDPIVEQISDAAAKKTLNLELNLEQLIALHGASIASETLATKIEIESELESDLLVELSGSFVKIAMSRCPKLND